MWVGVTHFFFVSAEETNFLFFLVVAFLELLVAKWLPTGNGNLTTTADRFGAVCLSSFLFSTVTFYSADG